MGTKNGSVISRREFARRAALASAAASLSPAGLLPRPCTGVAPASQTSATPPAKASSTASAPSPQTPAAPKLSPESQAEADSRIQAVLNRYGARLSDAQKADLQRLAAEGQAGLDRLRAFTTDNGDGPALYLKPLMEREKKPAPKPTTAAKQPAAPKGF